MYEKCASATGSGICRASEATGPTPILVNIRGAEAKDKANALSRQWLFSRAYTFASLYPNRNEKSTCSRAIWQEGALFVKRIFQRSK